MAEARERGFRGLLVPSGGSRGGVLVRCARRSVEARVAGGARAVAVAAASGACGGAAAGGGRGSLRRRSGRSRSRCSSCSGSTAASRCWWRSMTCSGSMRRRRRCSRSRFGGWRRRRPRFSSRAAAAARRRLPLGLERAFPEERLRRLRLGPLSVGATHRLLRERLGVSFPRPTLVQLHERSGGNPFYALELARALEQSGGARARVSGWPFPRRSPGSSPHGWRRCRRTFARCSSPSRCSASRRSRSSRQWHPTRRRCSNAFVQRRPLAILELDDDERVRFGHPLLAAQVEAELDPRRRRSLHRRLAELVGDAEQRARHLALGANGPSARVADELETASASRPRVARRGRPRSWPSSRSRSRRPRPATASSRRRQLLAADQHYASGDVERARAILEPLVEQLPAGCRARARCCDGSARPRLTISRGRSGSSSRRSSRPRPILG